MGKAAPAVTKHEPIQKSPVRTDLTPAPTVEKIVDIRTNGVVLPAAVVEEKPTTTAAPAPTTTTPAPTTTTTKAPTTTTKAPATTTKAPLRIKSFVVNSFGQPVSVSRSPAPAPSSVSSSAPAPVAPRQPKKIESASRPKGNYQ